MYVCWGPRCKVFKFLSRWFILPTLWPNLGKHFYMAIKKSSIRHVGRAELIMFMQCHLHKKDQTKRAARRRTSKFQTPRAQQQDV